MAQPVQFTIAGTGQLPQEQRAGHGAGRQRQPATASRRQPTARRPGGGLGAPDDPNAINDPWAKYKWWILSALGLALVVGAGVMLKAGQPTPAAAVAGVVPPLPYAEASSLAAAQSEVYPAAAPVAGPGVRCCTR